MSNFKINKQTNLRNDKCAVNMLNNMNNETSGYNLVDYLGTKKNRNYYFDSFNQPSLFQTGNFSGYPEHIDDGSYIKNGQIGNILTHGTERRTFDTKNYITPPFKGPKTMVLNPDKMSELIYGDSTRGKTSIRGKSIDRFVPLVPEIQKEIQNPKNLIPKYWVRGGMDTKVVIRNIDYMKTCGLKK